MVRVRGIVQGVGFRPFVYRLAISYGVTGWVQNGDDGVQIHAEGSADALASFIRELEVHPPPAARVQSVEVLPTGVASFDQFRIVESVRRDRPTACISPDLPVCDACLSELFDPTDKRHGYPYINCTDCGPRFSIILGLPYDRLRTTMRDWDMCARCDAEYNDPADRRFHAQPLACGACGPRYTLKDGTHTEAGDYAAIEKAVSALAAGKIVAIKGLGGYHLACDAKNIEAVAALRARKYRKERPFAVMAKDIETARDVVELSADAEVLIASRERPIVLAPARVELHGVAPDNVDLGVMLPYTPLHHLLFARGAPKLLVMTSANHSSEPIAYLDHDALERLSDIADLFLVGERSIARRVDDSVVRVGALGPTVLRRSRGYAPQPMALPVPASRSVLAVGAELKSTVTLAAAETFVTSHHLGDLSHLPTYLAFLQAVDHLCGLYEVMPEVVAHDLHPEYLSTKFAIDLDRELLGVQHHHAHIASCLAEHRRVDPVLGLAFDGLGYGPDGSKWGGEVLLADLRGFERLGHLAPVTMPGGAAAVREPWRMGVAWAERAGVDPPFDDERLDAIHDMVVRRTGPVTTSVGRLFDAVASLLGLAPTATYEAQAAIQLEAAAWPVPRSAAPSYPVAVELDGDGCVVIDPAPLVAAVVADRDGGRPLDAVAAGFHESFGRAAADVAIDLARAQGVETVALSGGVFQNARLSACIEERISSAGLEVLTHRLVPPNDGGISVGQAAIAAASI